MKKRIAVCILAILVMVSFSAQADEYYRYGTYIGSDDIDNDMFLLPYDEDGMYQIELYLGDTQRSIEGTAVQSGNTLNFKASFTGSTPRYTGTIEPCGKNEYKLSLKDSYNPKYQETFKFCWVAEGPYYY